MTPTHLMTVEKLQGRKNEFHEVVEEYTPAFEVWVELKPLNMRERERAAAVGRTVSHSIDCHWHPDLNGSCRLNYQGRVFDISDILNVDEQNKMFKIVAHEVVE